jgi:hypothetical protein
MDSADDKPTVPGFISLLAHTTEAMPPSVKAVVQAVIEKRNFKDTLHHFEIRQEHMLRDLVKDIVQAVDQKMAGDFKASVMGSESFQSAMYQAVAFALVVGAALAKDKKI